MQCEDMKNDSLLRWSPKQTSDWYANDQIKNCMLREQTKNIISWPDARVDNQTTLLLRGRFLLHSEPSMVKLLFFWVENREMRNRVFWFTTGLAEPCRVAETAVLAYFLQRWHASVYVRCSRAFSSVVNRRIKRLFGTDKFALLRMLCLIPHSGCEQHERAFIRRLSCVRTADKLCTMKSSI